MKRLSILTFLLLFSISNIFSQDNSSEEKNRLITEILQVTKMDSKFKESFESIMKSMSQTYPSTLKEIIDEDESLSLAERDALEKKMLEQQTAFQTKFRKRLLEEIDFEEYFKLVVYPMYSKFFDEHELKDLLEFYKSPTGQKLTDVQTDMAIESIMGSQKVLFPTISRIVKEIVEEELQKSKKKQVVKSGGVT